MSHIEASTDHKVSEVACVEIEDVCEVARDYGTMFSLSCLDVGHFRGEFRACSLVQPSPYLVISSATTLKGKANTVQRNRDHFGDFSLQHLYYAMLAREDTHIELV
eukprot:gnl/TRDRNA2_/TRDRNA2_166534_c1_seq1.p1 gnl/TRDRNA2_/TRDRNA2_166534_c1~~gnl/TRDRNA2_/TRDRNA2_166534_c1_seq1.p1  ORF type:complete len:106 (+),score=7.11 gnl/TRDRNA2_/TRDRNA2_166534_c1_seq1:201-518(+)